MTNYSYFSGANVLIRLNNRYTLECAGISFNLSNSAQPAYGYASQEFDMVLPGRKLLQGSFVVNYTEANYLSEMISSLRGDTVEDITDRNELFDISIQYGRSNSKRDLLLKNCYLISRGQTIQISEQVILEEFSFIGQAVRNDIPSRRAQQSNPVLKAKPKTKTNPKKKQQTKQNTKVEAEILIVLDNYKSFEEEDATNAYTLGEATRDELIPLIEELSANPRFNLSFGFITYTGITFLEGSQMAKKSKEYLSEDSSLGLEGDFWDGYKEGNIRISMLNLESFLREDLLEEGPRKAIKEYLLFYIVGDDAIYNEAKLAFTLNGQYPWKKKVLIKVSGDGKCLASSHQNLGNNSTYGDSFKDTSGWLVTCVGIDSDSNENNIKKAVNVYLNQEYPKNVV